MSVSLYDTLGADSVSYIINHATLSIIFTAPDKIPGLLRIANQLPNLKVIVSIDPLGKQVKPLLQAWGADKGIELYDMAECAYFRRKSWRCKMINALLFYFSGGIRSRTSSSCHTCQARTDTHHLLHFGERACPCLMQVVLISLFEPGYHWKPEGCNADPWKYGLRCHL